MRPAILSSCTFILLCCPVVAAVPAQDQTGRAEQYGQLLEDAVAALDAREWANWAYTQTDIGSDGVFVGRFDPARQESERWTLLLVNERAPTADEIEEYLDEKAGDNGWAGDGDDEPNTIVSMVEPEGLELIEETDTHYLFRFVPDEDELDEGFAEYLDATLRISKLDGPWLESIDIHSNGPFRPQFGVRVRDFVTRMTFAQAGPGGPIVPRSLEVKISLRALLVISVDEHIITTYDEYERVGD